MAERADDVTSAGGRRRGGRKVVPLLPAQQSPAERVASNKNRILQRRLQFHLDILTRDRRAWLVQRRTEASRYRRRADLLHHLLTPQPSAPSSDLPLTPDNCALICRDLTSARDVSSRRGRSGKPLQRPSTSVQFRISNDGCGRPKAGASQPRPKTTGAWRGEIKPLFRVRDNAVNTSSSDEDDVDSDDFPSTEDSDSGKCYNGVVKMVSTFHRKAPTRDTSLSRNVYTGNSSLKKGMRSSQSALIQTPKPFQAPRFTGVGRGREQMKPRSQRGQGAQGQTSKHQKQDHGIRNPRIIMGRPRAQTTLGISRELGTPASAATGGSQVFSRGKGSGGVGESGGRLDASYINHVLNIERSKYEMSQKKVKDYLKSLTI